MNTHAHYYAFVYVSPKKKGVRDEVKAIAMQSAFFDLKQRSISLFVFTNLNFRVFSHPFIFNQSASLVFIAHFLLLTESFCTFILDLVSTLAGPTLYFGYIQVRLCVC